MPAAGDPNGFPDPIYPPAAPGPDFGASMAVDNYGQPVDPQAQTVALPGDHFGGPGQVDFAGQQAPADLQAPAGPAEPSPSAGPTGPAMHKHSRTGAAWVALVVAAVVFIFLLVFIMQNSDPVLVKYFGFEWTMSLGVAMMFAAVLGALTAGLLGTVRILQLRARARRARKAR